MKYAKSLRINGVSLVSEGNFTGDNDIIDEFIWGWNKDGILYEDFNMQWTERTRDLTIKNYPILKGKVKVSGAVGFDQYKIGGLIKKNIFLKKYSKDSFEKVIGFGCWDFGLLDPRDPRYSAWSEIYNKNDRDRFISDQMFLNNILRDIVTNNPDILFLLKEHPGCLGGRRASAIEGLDQYQNTLILKNEESIKDCIGICDFWIAYESTTALEAWLLNKQTCLLNPSGTDFKRDNVYLGSPNYPNVQALQDAIDFFYSNGFLPGFSKLEGERKKIVKDTIQWDDGFNHVRAGNEIIDLINKEKPKRQPIPRYYMKEIFKQFILWYLSPSLSFLKKFEFYAERRKAFNKKQLRAFQEKCMNEQINFYEKNNLTKDDLRMIRFI